jgi:hypothetical protein
MWVKELYYAIKPLIPRGLQIKLRRIIVSRQMNKFQDVWPIDQKASRSPEGWAGWPEGKQFALVLTHDVDTARGQEQSLDLMALEQRLGFRSSFNFVPERYNVSNKIRQILMQNDFEVGVHGLNHDGKYFKSRQLFQKRAVKINKYLKEWQAVGFRMPSMLHKLEWMHDLDIEYDASTFDTDPFEPQPDGMGTIFPFWVWGQNYQKGYVELPYTLPQDFTLYVLLREQNIEIWKQKLDWIASHGGMALVNTHPDYMNRDGNKLGIEEFPMRYYEEFLEYACTKYTDKYWHVLPRDMARYWKTMHVQKKWPIHEGENIS